MFRTVECNFMKSVKHWKVVFFIYICSFNFAEYFINVRVGFLSLLFFCKSNLSKWLFLSGLLITGTSGGVRISP